MSRSSSRSVKKKLCVSSVCPLPEIENNNLPREIVHKSNLATDIFNNDKINKFIAEEDFINFLPNSSGTSSASSSTDDLELKSTKVIQGEFDLVERLLYGEEKYEIYNKELDQWSENFKYLRLSGSKIKPPHSRKKTNDDDDIAEEIFAEHRDLTNTNYLQAYDLNEMKNRVKQAVIEKIIENARKPILLAENIEQPHKRQTWRKTELKKKNSSTVKPVIPKSFLPVRIGRENSDQGISTATALGKKHPIVRSNLSSAKWQKNSKDSMNFPMVLSRDSSKSSNDSFLSIRTASREGRSTILPAIQDYTTRKMNTLSLRSRSCNIPKRNMDLMVIKSKFSARTNSSSGTDS